MLKAVTQYAIVRFATMRGYSMSRRLLAGYLSRSYTWFLNRHSADLGANILTDVNKVIGSALMPAMKLLSQGALVLFLVALLVAVNPLAAGILALLLGGSYALIYAAVRKRLVWVGARRHLANKQRFQISGDAMAGIKDVKVLGLEASYVRRFSRPAREIAEADALNAVVGEVPRYVLEAVAFGGLLLFVLFLLATGSGSLGDIVPMLGVYAFAALRLFPALQQVYTSFAALRFSRPTLDKLHEDMTEIGVAELPAAGPRRKLPLGATLGLADVHYSYPGAERPALAGVDMTIPVRSSVGIVGGTGAGKTTVVDVILGLLRPERGALEVDGAPVSDADLRAWQNGIGYVPQQIFLTDDTVRANIAFGLEPAEVDAAAVERAARVAELHDFVMRELPRGYDTEIGERGVRLSGGQRQRIGIARALYHDPDVLILDEATSALDNLTERAVMAAVANLGRAKTVIMIAHRLSTVRNCDVIFMMERGRVVARGQLRRAARPQPQLPGDGGRRPRMSPAPVLAIVAPSFNQVSETFVADHVRELAPGATVLICQDGRDAERFGLPVLADLDSESASGRRNRLAARIRRRAGFGPILARRDRERLAAFLRAQGVGVVLAEFGNTGATVAEVCAALGLPLFVCFRGHDATMHKRHVSMQRRYRRLFGQARGLVAESRFIAGELLAIGCPEALVEVIPSGVDPARFPPGRPEPGRILAVGRLVEMKAPHLTLRRLRRGGAGLPAGAPRPRRRRPAARALRGGDRRARPRRPGDAARLPAATPRWRR